MNIYLITSGPSLTKKQESKLKSFGNLIAIDAQKLSSKEVIKKAYEAEILIAGSSGVEKIDATILKGLPNLKLISLLTIGTAWVDLKTARNLGVTVSNAKGGSAESVAEHIWGMILGLAKRINEFEREAREKGAYKFTEYVGKETYGKTIGIIGLGDIGKRVAQISKAFSVKMLGVNKSGKKVKGVTLVSLDRLIKDSDIITVCVPLTDETRNMISHTQINRMKDGVILVNCAREQIVDKGAIIKAIKSGKAFGYGVETEIMQPIPENDPYWSESRIIVTPHNAFNTEESEKRQFDLMVSNVEAYIKGKPINVVN